MVLSSELSTVDQLRMLQKNQTHGALLQNQKTVPSTFWFCFQFGRIASQTTLLKYEISKASCNLLSANFHGK